MAEFDKELYMCKALTLEDEIIQGFYLSDYFLNNGFQHSIITPPFHDDEGVLRKVLEINPYSLCRNTGIKKNDVYLYENDLVEYSTAFDKGLAIVEFDDLRCRYMLRFNLDYSARGYIDKYGVKVIGNVALSDADMQRFAEYSKKQRENYIPDIEPECRSKHHLNKKAREFLPK